MGIQCIKKIDFYHALDRNYRCDLCGDCFKYKHDAKIHHKEKHISDKSVLDATIGKWYKNRCKDTYTRILSVDYDRNKVKVYTIHIAEYSRFFHLGYRFETSSCIQCMSLKDFKITYIVGASDWENIDGGRVWSALHEAEEYLHKELFKEDISNGY